MLICKYDNDIEIHMLELHQAELILTLAKDYPPTDEWLFPGNTVEAARKFVQNSLESYAQGKSFRAGIWYKKELAGVIKFSKRILGLQDPVHVKVGELDYMLAPAFRGKGIITKACSAMIDYAFDELGMKRMEIWVFEENKKSVAIPERLGFKKEGVLREAFPKLNLAIYGILKNEWKSAK
ncbi:GNAT family N-acetyltransferase [Planctomycetota bacterium]